MGIVLLLFFSLYFSSLFSSFIWNSPASRLLGGRATRLSWGKGRELGLALWLVYFGVSIFPQSVGTGRALGCPVIVWTVLWGTLKLVLLYYTTPGGASHVGCQVGSASAALCVCGWLRACHGYLHFLPANCFYLFCILSFWIRFYLKKGVCSLKEKALDTSWFNNAQAEAWVADWPYSW